MGYHGMMAIDSKTSASEPPMVIFDGACGFCQRSVQFVLRHERRHDLLFVRRESELGRHLRWTYGMEAVESMLWIEGGQVFAQSRSILRVSAYLGGWWSGLGRVASLIPTPLLNRIYNLIARNRHKLAFNPQHCLIPTSEQRSRFLG